MIKVGDTVGIVRKNYPAGRFEIEGFAQVVALTEREDFYLVCFPGETLAVRRRIDQAMKALSAEVYVGIVNRALGAYGIQKRSFGDA